MGDPGEPHDHRRRGPAHARAGAPGELKMVQHRASPRRLRGVRGTGPRPGRPARARRTFMASGRRRTGAGAPSRRGRQRSRRRSRAPRRPGPAAGPGARRRRRPTSSTTRASCGTRRTTQPWNAGCDPAAGVERRERRDRAPHGVARGSRLTRGGASSLDAEQHLDGAREERVDRTLRVAVAPARPAERRGPRPHDGESGGRSRRRAGRTGRRRRRCRRPACRAPRARNFSAVGSDRAPVERPRASASAYARLLPVRHDVLGPLRRAAMNAPSTRSRAASTSCVS